MSKNINFLVQQQQMKAWNQSSDASSKQQDSQCTHNVMLRRVRLTFVAVEKK